MTDYIRRIVSGNKARFRDRKLNLELDLVYITDQVIIMGYPAEGLESFYRNNREDAKRFLEHRHGKDFWVFNFCPIRENSYSAGFFDGRVSRYPFPDHHAPPLAIMPLAAREMSVWLDGAPERVVVLHCKAGKGRSGTLACTYLLAQDDMSTPPKLERSLTASEWAETRANDVIKAVEHEEESALPLTPVPEPELQLGEPPVASDAPHKSFTDSLKGVLDLHTARRMKPPGEHEKPKQGVSIPSQRRWLHYWALLLAHEAPAYMWSVAAPTPATRPKVRLTQITVRMREAGALKTGLVRAANAVIDRTSFGKAGPVQAGHGHVWVSLARYDDEFVRMLEQWEVHTRDEEGHMGRRRPGSEKMGGEQLGEVFDDKGKWDNTKMVRSFARLGATGDGAFAKTEHGKILTYTLHPLSESGWVNIRDNLKTESGSGTETDELHDVPASEANSMYDVTYSVKEKGVVLDAGREVRVKVYMGQVFICWLWLIPTFHMAQPPPAAGSASPPPTKVTLTRKETDFPLGLGSALIDLEISMEWLRATDSEAVQPPARQTSAEGTGEPAGVAATVVAVTAGKLGGVKQAAAD
ncbi:hypothetical protein B0H10DRAFT_1981154 [Mycena sp. CBHHK59/15]|nr:hypothetical protein B0H10DRAFT_1981154 [Mycena sp. CBHHK59/15]